MRTDLAQLLVERPRFNQTQQYRLQRHRSKQDVEQAPLMEGMRQSYNDRKHFNEYFAPLQRILRKNSGRRWNDVYSDIVRGLRGGGTVIEHVRTHLLRDFVIRQPHWREDGAPCYPSNQFLLGGRGLVLGSRGEVSYVDRQGILRFMPRKSEHRHKRPPFPRIPCDKESAFYKLNEVWYRVWTHPFPAAGPDVKVFDALVGETFESYKSPGYTGWRWHRTAAIIRVHGSLRFTGGRKTQLSSRTIRQHRLNERFAELLKKREARSE
jgi:hypothetical protein